MIKQRYKVGIDCRLLGTKHAGIGRYIENLVAQLAQNSTTLEFDWVLFFHDIEQRDQFVQKFERETPLLKQFLNESKIVYTPVRHYSIAEQLLLPIVFGREDLDLLHVPHFNSPILYFGQKVVTIHDLLWHEMKGISVTTLPPWQYWIKHLFYRFTVMVAVHSAKRIIVPSKTIANTVAQLYPTSEGKTSVTYEGVSSLFAVTKIAPLPKRNVLTYVGSLYPHKNVELVLSTLLQLPNWQLNIVSARSVFQSRLQKLSIQLGLKSRVHFFFQLSDQKLIKLLQQSTALIQPSLFEGFGLTGIEALSLGVPVISSKIPIFKEIYGSLAIYFDPDESASLVEAVSQLDGVYKSKKWGEVKREVLQKYSWQSLCQQTLGVYNDATSQT